MISCLDKGFARLCEQSSPTLEELLERYRPLSLMKHINVSFEIKCPLFMLSMFSEFGLITTTCGQQNIIEVYKTTVVDVDSTLNVNKHISSDINSISEELIAKPRDYVSDGCDPMIAQLNIPISTYTTVLISGQLSNWHEMVKYCETIKIHKLKKQYIDAVKVMLESKYSKLFSAL